MISAGLVFLVVGFLTVGLCSHGGYMVNDHASGFLYSGQWAHYTNKGAFGEDVHICSESNCSWEYTFTGTGVVYITPITPDQGKVQVFIDKRLISIPDCFSETIQQQKFVFSIRDLAYGSHTIKASKISGSKMVLDAINIIGYGDSGINYKISSINLGDFIPVGSGKGDTWLTTWSNDGNIYSTSCDTTAWDNECNSNEAINVIFSDPLKPTGSHVNCLESEFGTMSHVDPRDKASWKAEGFMSLNGTLYLATARNVYGEKQPVFNPSFVKSTDHGKTWSPIPSWEPSLNRYTSIFPGQSFSTPYLLNFGQDGFGNNVDESDKYVYAVSNDGYWTTGDKLFVGRADRNCFYQLVNGSCWEFVIDVDSDGNARWGSLSQSKPVLTKKGGLSSTALHYIAPAGLYILLEWYYPSISPCPGDTCYNISIWNFWSSPHPWGPFTEVGYWTFPRYAWYNPTMPNKWISQVDRNVIDAWVISAGYWGIYPGTYAPHITKVTINLEQA
eukprot:TRINITY_DN9494_c0_g1_i1.p1 TRINITY_DN9494_c0_g1~~TRINITY_DN9494_c0_g1_i1.p1  ORF type:complete len:521 (+),score=108.45 TRINITY_DN9494_c0_g1_i1:62-1564(+)